MNWLDAAVTVLQTTTESGAGSENVGGAVIFGIVVVVIFFVLLSGSSDDDEDESGSGRQSRGLCENCGYEWKPRKAPSERSTDPQCPDCGSTRVSIHYN